MANKKKKSGRKKDGGTGDMLDGGGPGVAALQTVKIPEIDDLAKVYIRERDRRMEMTPKEVKAKKALLEALHRHEKTIGRDAEHVLRYEMPDGSLITITPTEEKLKITRPDSGQED